MTRARWSVGRITGSRGAGLGNEMIAWGKAHIGASVFDARLVDPPWSINPRPYRAGFGSSRADLIPYAAAVAAPTVELDATTVADTGLDDYWDVCEALRPMVDASGRRVIMHSSGMSGGFNGIRRARAFLQGRLFAGGEVAAAGAEHELRKAGSVVVGVHARAGDFREGTLGPGVWNVRTPVTWQADCVVAFSEQSALPLTVVVCSDDGARGLVADLGRRLPAGSVVVPGSGSALADLARLSWADLVIPSVSSYSMAALFLGDALYAWPEQHLTNEEGRLSIWGSEPRNHGVAGESGTSSRFTRGMPQGDAPNWPDWAIEQLEMRLLLRNRATDLVLGGVVPEIGKTPGATDESEAG